MLLTLKHQHALLMKISSKVERVNDFSGNKNGCSREHPVVTVEGTAAEPKVLSMWTDTCHGNWPRVADAPPNNLLTTILTWSPCKSSLSSFNKSDFCNIIISSSLLGHIIFHMLEL
jgi:hypothetical protein